MSVLKNNRSESKAQFVATADKVYVFTIDYVTLLPSRYRNLLAPSIIKIASEVIEFAEKANSLFPNTPTNAYYREINLKKAKGSLLALDIELKHCYNIMIKNPNGCFKNENGKNGNIKLNKSKEKLEHKTNNLGKIINKEELLLNGTIKSVQEKRKKLRKSNNKEELKEEPKENN